VRQTPLGVKTITHLSVHLAGGGAHGLDFVKTDKLPQAGLMELVRRIWLEGLPTPDLVSVKPSLAVLTLATCELALYKSH